ncbi:MAG: TIGR03663 family protein [Kiritimatiellae bacterium]|nr:TIGR03663 family protein [Kiritimatiellia bacterium]MDD5522125.1 TIGR03663 family protein [Kiritimatiellia bacterium]
MKSSLISVVLIVFVLLAALAFRLPNLSLRPMHHDEANQALKCGILIETGVYKYDSSDHHGPSMYYITLPFAWLTSGKDFAGTSESTFRMVQVIFGVGTILLLLFLQDGLGRTAVFVSGLLMAISPAMVYYSRFYIQEILLVFFTLGLIISGWRYFKMRTTGWAISAGFFAGMMFATKETSVIAYAAIIGASFLTFVWERFKNHTQTSVSGSISLPIKKFCSWHVLAFLVVAGFISVMFFTSFFTNWRGALDSILAYKTYAGKSTDSPHIHPWYYYLQILAYWKNAPGPVWSEGLILVLAFAGLVAVLTDRVKVLDVDRVFVRFLVFYTVLMTVVYSVIPYKTPWCLLSFLSGMILLAGVGVVFLLNLVRGHLVRGIVCVLLIAACYNLAKQAHVTNFKYYTDPRNPYVYAHTTRDFLNLVKRVETLSLIHPQGKKMLIAVVASPYQTWPLPWYLRSFPEKGFWQIARELPEGLKPAVVVVSADQHEAVLSRLGSGYHAEYYGLRPDVLLTMLISNELWDAFIKGGGAAGIENKHGSSTTREK